MANFDPFDDPITNEDSPRGPGRPRTRQIREKGSVGRPRVRPINDPSSRRRGRPSVTPGSVADSIATETIVSGQMTAKAINASVQGLQGAIGAFQKGVVNPLATQVSAFSQAVGRFNKSHQEYLREQIAVSKEIHETYKLIRKVGIDPIIRNAERSRMAIASVTDVMKQINKEKYQGKEYEQMISSLTSMDRKLNRMVTTGVVGAEVTDTFLREYYRSAKGTSKFLNAVTFAAEDIAEDIQTLKQDLNKYFRGKNSSKTVLQDNSESLKRIEKNTKGLGIMVASSVMSGISALVKTAFTFNRYGTTDAITELLNIKKTKGASKLSQQNPLGKVFSTILGGIQKDTAFQEASLGGYGDFAKGIAESFEKTGRRITRGLGDLRGLGKSIADAWDHSKVKWFWDVGLKMIEDKWDRQGAIGVSIVSRVKSAYGRKNYRGPHNTGKRFYGSQEEALAGIQKAIDKFDRSKSILNEMGDWESDNEAAVAFSPEYLREHLTPRNKAVNRSTNNIIDARSRFGKTKRSNKGKADILVDAAMGKGAKVISINPKSTNQISSADVSTPRKAWGSLTKIQGRILGVLQRLEKHIRGIDKNTENLDELENQKGEGLLGGLLKGAGALGLGSLLLRNRKLLRGKGGKGLSLLGKTVFGAAAARKGFQGLKAVGKMGKLGKVGAGARVLWDTLGWGSSNIGNGAMKAVGQFKNTKLGRSFLGKGLRQMRVAAAGYGQGAGSRLLRAFAHSRKWGGGLLGNTIGAYKGFVAPARSIEGFAKMANPTRGLSLLQKGGLLMDKAGAGIVSGAKAAGGAVSNVATKAGNWLGGIGKLPKQNIFAKSGNAIAAMGKGAGVGAGLMKGLGVFVKKLPVIGGILQIGLAINDFKKGKIWDGIVGITMGLLSCFPATALIGLVGSVAWDAGKLINKKLKDKEGLNDAKTKKGILSFFGVKDKSAKGSTTPVAGGSSAASGSPADNNSAAKKGGVLAGMKAAAKAGAASLNKAAASAGAAVAEVAGNVGSSLNSSKGIDWGGTNHSQMMPEFMERFNAAADEFYKDTGKKVRVTSAIRTNKKQAELYVRGAYLHEGGVMTPAKPAMDEVIEYKGKTYYVKGKGQKTRTGHMAGGAVDVSNWSQFYPYATKHGLSWMGKNDPVHFQINKAGPVIGATTPVSNPPAGAKVVGDGPGEASGGVVSMGSANSVGNAPAGKPNANSSTEISPMIQDYGLAIINNLLFA